MYEYDADGRLVASRPEAEWDDTERQWMLGLEEYRSQVLCPCGCGYPAEVSQDPMAEFRSTVGPPVRCHVRTALERAQTQYRESNPKALMGGLLWSAEVRDA